MTTILTNAKLVTEDGVVSGTLVYGEGGIVDVQPGKSAGGEDAEGDFIAPGLIECHTDNLERHFVPRPGVIWPNPVAAVLAHDAQIVAAGITTVYDAICIGGYDDEKDHRPKIMGAMIEAVEEGIAKRLFRASHKLHFRCEMTDSRMMGLLEKYAATPSLALASLMDHTLGQRQWRNLDHYRRFIRGEGRTDEEIEKIISDQIETTSRNAKHNFEKAVAFFRGRGVPLASHDDTTLQHIQDAVAGGCTISEFPTTVEAARAAHGAGMKTVAGAPNVVRGGSHSGGVAVSDLAAKGLVDVLSSDYVPASLLQAVTTLGSSMPLQDAFGLVTWRAADMLGLADRGRLKPGLRADFVRYRLVEGTPVIRAVTVAGERVF
jgi:alpha-D-ribose 1-methylphosphonate 5-triphosphate diphosphatase